MESKRTINSCFCCPEEWRSKLVRIIYAWGRPGGSRINLQNKFLGNCKNICCHVIVSACMHAHEACTVHVHVYRHIIYKLL